MENRTKLLLAFLLAALQPPALYFAFTFIGQACSSRSAASLVVVVFFPPLLLFCNRQRHRLCGHAPAYAAVVGHLGTAILTFFIKLLLIAGFSLGILFCLTSCAFAILFARMIMSDPGRVEESHSVQGRQTMEESSSSNDSLVTDKWGRRHYNLKAYDMLGRGKYCQYCHSFIERYDHHCAAVQNCVGSKNMGTFLLLLTTACIMEILYLACCYLYLKDVTVLSAESYLKDGDDTLPQSLMHLGLEILTKEAWVLGISIFVGLQILWQVPFLAFQLYLIGINLTTDEWVNWEEIPRFHKQGTTVSEYYCPSKIFINPYDGGFMNNYKALLHKWK